MPYQDKPNSFAPDSNQVVEPRATDAEQAVLGMLLTNSDALDYALEQRISHDDFYHREHAVIASGIFHLSNIGREVDHITVTSYLQESKQLDKASGVDYIKSIVLNAAFSSNFKSYIDIVVDFSQKRQLLKATRRIQEMIFENAKAMDAHELINRAESVIFELTDRRRKKSQAVSVQDAMKSGLKVIEQRFEQKSALSGLSSGFKDLDVMTSGLQAGELVIVAGRPSMGKTSLALNMIENTIIQEKRSAVLFSMEMSAESIAMRLFSSLGSIEQVKLRSGKLSDSDWRNLVSVVSLTQDVHFYIDESPTLSPADIQQRVRRLQRSLEKEQGNQQPIGLIVIDYIQLMAMRHNAENRAMEISSISRMLKNIAKEFSVPVIALSQLNRSLENRQDKRPMMADLRESGAIEQDADLILMIYRDEVYNKETSEKPGIAEINIAKQRNGPTGAFELSFNGRYSRFDDLALSRDR